MTAGLVGGGYRGGSRGDHGVGSFDTPGGGGGGSDNSYVYPQATNETDGPGSFPTALVPLDWREIRTKSVADVVVGLAYSQQLVADIDEVVWSIASGKLPAGLSLKASTGLISGMPTDQSAGPVPVTFRVTDPRGAVSEQELVFDVHTTKPVITDSGVSERWLMTRRIFTSSLAFMVVGKRILVR